MKRWAHPFVLGPLLPRVRIQSRDAVEFPADTARRKRDHEAEPQDWQALSVRAVRFCVHRSMRRARMCREMRKAAGM